MKLTRVMALLLMFILLTVNAQAATWYVYTPNGKTLNLRSPANNAVIGNIPYGTKLESDDMLSTETAAYVSWGGKAGFVKWNFLVKDPPPSANGTKPAPMPKVTATPKPEKLLPTDGDGLTTIQALGAYLEYNSNKSKGKFSAISYDKPVKLKVTADVPKGRTIDYWVIDGVRYDFKSKVPTSFTIDNAADNMIVEAVLRNKVSQTELTEEGIQQTRTGETLLVKTIHAKLAHVRDDLKGAGGWITSFDFTDDYTNRATKKREDGGQVTVRVKASIPKGKKISYWKFDDVKIDFDKYVTEMIVYNLNVSKTYEPVFGKAKTTTTERDEPPAENPQYYQVDCVDCTFSGGGYTNAHSGQVKAGTKITVTTHFSEVSHWRINGVELKRTIKVLGGKRPGIKVTNTSKTITRTINKDTKIVCYSVIN